MNAAFLDASAFVKLVLAEPESDALREELASWAVVVSADLLRTEAPRACGRLGPRFAARARELLAGLALVPLDGELLDAAAEAGGPGLRSLDAIYLAAALRVRDELGAFLVYDERLAQAARAAGLPVAHPGR